MLVSTMYITIIEKNFFPQFSRILFLKRISFFEKMRENAVFFLQKTRYQNSLLTDVYASDIQTIWSQKKEYKDVTMTNISNSNNW